MIICVLLSVQILAGEISGKVQFNGNAINMVVVEIQPHDKNLKILVMKTDKTGSFRFSKLPGGNYKLTA